MQCRRRDPSRWPLRISASLIFVSSLLGAAETIAQRTAGTSPGTAPVEFFGCTALKGTAQQFSCMLVPDDQLTLWVRGRDCKDIQVADSGQPLQAETKFIQGGCQLRLPRSSGLHQSTLTLTDRRTQQPLWSMPLDRSKPTLLEWKRKVWDRASSNLEDILPDLQRRATERLDPEELIDVTYALGWVNYRLGHRSEAVQQLSYLSRLAEKYQYRSISVDAGYYQSFLLRTADLPQEAQATLDNIAQFAIPGDSRGSANIDKERAGFAFAGERLDVATGFFDRAHDTTVRVDDRAVLVSILPQLAELHHRLGHSERAEQLLTEMAGLLDGQPECKQAGLWAFAGAVGIEIGIDLGKQVLIVGRPLRDILQRALAQEKRCMVSSSRAVIFLSLMQLSRLEGKYAEAHDWAEKFRLMSDYAAHVGIEFMEQEALLALAEGRGNDALRLFRAMDLASKKLSGTFINTYKCSAAVGIAEAQSAQSQSDPQTQDVIRNCLAPTSSFLSVPLRRGLERRANRMGLLTR